MNVTAEADRTRRPFALDEGIAILERTPRVLDALLRGLPDSWVNAHEGGDTWSPFDVVGHLVHGERTDWIPRARITLEHGDTRAFEPFDRFAQFRDSKGKTLPDLLDEFARASPSTSSKSPRSARFRHYRASSPRQACCRR
jgi:DinB superfamily